jgi:hypothetical protein
MSLFFCCCCCCCCAVLLLTTENAHQITWTPTWSLHAAPRSRRAVLRTVRVFRRSVATYASNSMPTIWSPILIGSGEGSEPEWNETFIFTVSDDTTPQLHLKIMDSDVTDDDFVGEATWVPRPGIFAPVCTGLHYSLPNPRPLRSAQTSVHEPMPLNFQLRFICRLKRAWLLCLCLYVLLNFQHPPGGSVSGRQPSSDSSPSRQGGEILRRDQACTHLHSSSGMFLAMSLRLQTAMRCHANPMSLLLQETRRPDDAYSSWNWSAWCVHWARA